MLEDVTMANNRIAAPPTPAERIAVRNELLHLARRELCGPYESDEFIQSSPQNRYICGQIAPIRSTDEDSDDELEFQAEVLAGASDADVATPEDVLDPAERDEEQIADTSSLARARRNSLTSIGMSFSTKPDVAIAFVATWGEYEREGDGFRRLPRRAEGSFELAGPTNVQKLDFGRVSIQWVARRTEDRLLISVFLVNTTPFERTDGSDRLYQVQLALRTDAEDGFLPRDDSYGLDRRAEINDLLYLDRREYAVGLNTAVVHTLEGSPPVCRALTTETMPSAETRVTTMRKPTGDVSVLSMSGLADLDDPQLLTTALKDFFSDYGSWAEELELEAKAIPQHLAALARAQLVRIRERIERIQSGILILQNNKAAFKAFRFANEAMARAQERASKEAKELPAGALMDPQGRKGSWHPFQLAFLVSTVPELVSASCNWRNIVDVLFFPTGGGKTEAYLGLSAFAMAYRRLSGEDPNGGAGVSTLMRYTLRLLTTQQFGRAATMICAAETIRRERVDTDDTLGDVPFSIGLWVGPMTPNSYESAIEIAKKLRAEHNECPRNCKLSRTEKQAIPKYLTGREGSVLPITDCPWCFKRLCIECVESDEAARRIVIRCSNTACIFSNDDTTSVPTIKGLPLFVVDEDVYHMTPSLVVGTVDKFATMPFAAGAKSLFGNVARLCQTCGYISDATPHPKSHVVQSIERHSSIDLILQDELHTITDNLGSIYGLYETAIDFLATRNTVRPKYVCATATVKDVELQISSLYGRSTAIFPPTGLKAGDTFFSEDLPAEGANFGRTYVGIYAPTFSRLSTFVAVLGALLAAAARVAEINGSEAADPYLTLLGYFNTVRDLGSVKALLGDDVPPLLEEIARRNNWPPRKLFDWESELTGRISAAEVPERLATLASKYREGAGCDFMAATNMISVGVDVQRLGMMLVDGQPKTTSEYIQSTSRVGRFHPGVVFVAYNAMRPRDVSHYEHFHAYHDALYRFVEAGSVTPFSDGAIDRYLRAAIASAYRMGSEHSLNEDAARYRSDISASAVLDAFRARAAQFGPHEETSAETTIDDLDNRWRSATKDLVYSVSASRFPAKANSSKPKQRRFALIRPIDQIPDDSVETIFTASRSMRSVEADIPLRTYIDG